MILHNFYCTITKKKKNKKTQKCHFAKRQYSCLLTLSSATNFYVVVKTRQTATDLKKAKERFSRTVYYFLNIK